MNTDEIPGEVFARKHDIFTTENDTFHFSHRKRSLLLWLRNKPRFSEQ